MSDVSHAAVVSGVVNTAVETALRREDVPIANVDVAAATPKVAATVLRAIDQSGQAVVPVASPWTSKVNVTATATAVISLLVGLGIPISDELKVTILTLVGTLGPVIIAVFKTFFTRSISSASK